MMTSGAGGRARFGAAFAAALVLSITLGCRRDARPVVESRSETKSTSPEGTDTTTTVESRQVGSTLVGKTEVKSDTGEGTIRSETETVIGTVTEYVPGKRIEVLTGEDKRHRYDLGDRETTVQAGPAITIGSRVRLVQSKDNEGRKKIEISPEDNP